MSRWTQHTNTLANVASGLLAAVGAGGLLVEAIDRGEAVGVVASVVLFFPLLWFGLSLALKILLFPAIALLIGLYQSLRRGVREARVAYRRSGLDAVAVHAQSTADAVAGGLPDAQALTALPWTRRARYARYWPLLVAVVAALPLAATLLVGLHLFGPAGAFWLTITVGAVAAAGLALLVPPAGLGATLLEHAAAACALEPRPTLAPSADRRDAVATLRLPSGPPITYTLSGGRNARRLTLTVITAPLPFDAALVTHDALAAERTDLDTGDPAFDRATLLRPHTLARRDALVTAWLPPDVRTVLLHALALGATHAGRRLTLPLDLRATDAPRALADALTLLTGWHHLIAALAALSPTDRALAALAATPDDTERTHLLAECATLADPADADAIRSAWALQGHGPTRLAAALDLSTPPARGPALVHLAADPDAPARTRVEALARLTSLDRAAATAALTALAQDPDPTTLHAATAPPSLARALAPALTEALRAGLADAPGLPAASAAPLALLTVLGGVPAPADTLARCVDRALSAPSAETLRALLALAHAPEAVGRLDVRALATRVDAHSGGLALIASGPVDGALSLRGG